ncbi:MAG: transcriptional regulator, AraC family [Paenibacillaceae bacterium]|jgi:AraC-like DNA-binding protein|nr:transcriptional regulator, AraC family [Paenibacillaceae bacterium]
MNKKWYSRLLLSYLPLFSVAMIVLIMIFYVLLNAYARQEMDKVNRVYTGYVRDALDTSLVSMERTITQEFLTNTHLQAYFESNMVMDSFQSYEAYRALTDLVAMNDFIHSIYLYRRFDGQVLTHIMNMPIEQFSDRAFIERHLDTGFEGWTDPRSYRASEPLTAISLVKQLPFGSGTLGLLVVNVEIDKIQQFFVELSGANSASMSLIARDGQVMAGESTKTGTEFRAASREAGWDVRSRMDGKNLVQLVSSLPPAWLTAGSLFLILCFASLILITRRNYRPVEYILERIHSYSSRRGHLDDFQFIESSIEALLQQSQEYKEKSRFDLFYKKKHYFLELLEGNVTWETVAGQLDPAVTGLLPHAAQSWYLVMEMDQYSGFVRQYHAGDQNLLKFALFSIIKEMAELQRVNVWQEWIANQQIAVILQCKEQPEEETVLEYCHKLRSWVETNLSFTVTLALGPAVEQLSEIHHSYLAAMEALDCKATVGSNSVIPHTAVKEQRNGEIYDRLISIRSMCHMFRLGKQEEWEQLFSDICGTIQHGTHSHKELVNLINFLIYHLNNEMNELAEEYANAWNGHGAPRLYKALDEFETWEELRGLILCILQDLFARIETIRANNSQLMAVRAVKDYISRHYADPGLSLIQVSDVVNMQPVQLSRMFKDEFGEKFIDYVASVRVDQAKRLLLSTDASIQEIGRMVGYLHSFSFIRLFKKIVGETPGEFRKKQ